MKKMILLTTALVSFTFAQTGMMTNSGDSGMGVWLNYTAMNLDSDVNDMVDPRMKLKFDYMMDMGLEVSFEYVVDYYGADDFNPMNLGVSYHMKSEDGMSWAFGLNMTDVADDADIDNTGMHLTATGYCSSLLWFGLDYNMSWDDTSADDTWLPNEIGLSVGKLWNMDSFAVGVSYTFGTDEVDMGWLNLDVGTTF